MNETIKKTKNIKLNIIFNGIYQIFVLIVPFITSPYISRVLLPSGIGSYSYALSLVSYFSLIAAFGFLDYGTTQIAKLRDNKEQFSKIFWEICFAKFAVTITIFIIYVAIVMSGFFSTDNYPLNTKIIFLILGCNILVNGMDATFLFQGLENFGQLCLRNFIVRLLNTIFLFIFVRTSNDYLNYIIIMSGSNILLGLFSFIGIHRKISKPFFKDFHFLKHITHGFIYFIPTAAVTIFPLIPKTFIGNITNNSLQSGYYEQADKLVTLVITMINSIDNIMMSRMTYLYAINDKEEIQNKTQQTLKLFFAFTLPALFGLFIINPYFTTGFFGTEYESSVQLVYLLLPRLFFAPLTAIIGVIYFVPTGQLWKRNILYIISFVIDIILCFTFTKFFGIQGTCIAYSITEIILCILFIIFSKKDLHLSIAKNTFIKSFDSCLIMLIGCYFIQSFLANKFSNLVMAILLIIVGGMIYLICMLLFKEEIVTCYLKVFKTKICKKLRK